MDAELDQDAADAVVAGLIGGAMANCPQCGKKNLSTYVFRGDQEHPDEVYHCQCGQEFDVYMPETIFHCAREPMRGLVPFTEEGNQERWATPFGVYGKPYRLRPNFVFEDTLTYLDTEKTRRAFCFVLTRKSTGTTVTALHGDFKAFIPQMVRGEVTGKFTFRKRGYSCGVTFAKEKKQRAPRKYKKRTTSTKPKP